MAFRFKRRAKTHSNSTIATLRLTASTGLPNGEVNALYGVDITAVGGLQPYVFTALNSLPPGLTVNSSGHIGGTPSTTVTSTFTLHVQDVQGSTVRDSYRLQVISSGADAPLGLSIQSSTGAPQGVVNSSYALVINSTGGIAPYVNFTLVGGSLPPGITLASTGTLNGTPSTTGASTFSIQVTDSVGSTARQSFRLNVISSAVSTGAHAFYNQMIARPEVYRSWSLRGASTVDTKVTQSSVWAYIWPDDGYADAQDALKLVKSPNSSAASSDSLPSQIHFPMGISTGSIFLTYDFYYGPEWKTNIGGVTNHKEFNVCDGTSTGGTGVYFETRNGFGDAAGSTNVALVNLRSYMNNSTKSTSAQFTPGLIDFDAVTPTGQGALPVNGYAVKPGIWTRYWYEIHTGLTGDQFTEWNTASSGVLPSTTTYRRMSIWMADEVTDPQRVGYRIPWPIRNPYMGVFRFEFNTSSAPSSNGNPDGQTGTLIGYARNMVMLRDAVISDSDTSVFKRPVR